LFLLNRSTSRVRLSPGSPFSAGVSSRITYSRTL
jgi:hypothetical protein